VKARKRFGQHFLEAAWVRKVVDVIGPGPGDVFLEIGAGTGALTNALAARGARVTAVELDRDLAAQLRDRLPSGVRLIEADVLRVDLESIVEQSVSDAGPARSLEDEAVLPQLRIAGNLPYNISSPVLIRLIELARHSGRVSDATLMLQHEVAERVVARPGTGDYGPLSIRVQLYADARRLLSLPPGAFRPAPRVHSAVVGLRFRAPSVALKDPAVFDSLVRAVFTQRRKTLSNALRAFAAARGRAADAALAEAGIDGGRRPETLTLAEFAALSATFAGPDELPVL
jgi:16S rRNA (adenine1518-N6/adenine1519-N6)-dimethyltransferase